MLELSVKEHASRYGRGYNRAASRPPTVQNEVDMARPRKAVPQDPFSDLSKKTEILEREMSEQRAAIERLKQLRDVRAQPLPARHPASTPDKRRASR
jgi:hypothetical protein